MQLRQTFERRYPGIQFTFHVERDRREAWLDVHFAPYSIDGHIAFTALHWLCAELYASLAPEDLWIVTPEFRASTTGRVNVVILDESDSAWTRAEEILRDVLEAPTKLLCSA